MRRFLLALLACGGVVLALAAGASPARAQDLECDPGDREVRSLDFIGNHAFTDDELALRIVTTPSTWSRRHLRVFGTRRCLDMDELVRDKYRLQLLYRQAGYYNTKVDTLLTAAGKDQVNVKFLIDEGQPVRIRHLTITGLDSVRNRDELLRGLWVAVGKPYDFNRIQADVATVLGRLRNDGYPQPDFLRNYDVDKDSLTARVAITFLPGPLVHIGAVKVDDTPNRGKKQEISDRIIRKLVGIGPGDTFREQSLIDAQRNLYQTNSFRYVEIAPVLDTARLIADSTMDLKVTVIEDYMRDLNTEFGWATLDCFRARAQVVDKNFLGGAQRLELTGAASKIGWGMLWNDFTRHNLCRFDILNEDPFSVANYSFNATVRQPALFGTWATPSFSLYTERRSEYKAYLRTTYIGGEASLLRALSSTASLRVGYNVEYGKTLADPTLLCAAFSQCDSASIANTLALLPLAVFSVAAARVRTDNPVNPTDGYALRAESRNSATFLGSSPQLTFVKGVGDAAWYHPLAGNVLALRLHLGSVWGGASVNGVTQPPQQERLYAGGAASVRGYQQNELGSLLYVFDDTTQIQIRSASPDSVYFVIKPGKKQRRVVPVGGNRLFVASVDYRVRSPILPQLLQFTLFTDAGTVWNWDTSLPRGGFAPRFTPGIGVRAFTPLGPIQINAGYNPYPPVFGQPLFTPNRDLAQKGFTGVYCAVPDGTPADSAPKSGLNPTNQEFQQNPNVVCRATYQQSPPTRWISRFTFTFSIGPEF
jgi:outer membrane protein assembly complex protein YaeT